MASDDRPYGTVTEAAGRGAVYEGHGPQAVYDADTDSTYVVYRGPDADPYATRFDHATREFDEPTRIGANPLSNADNHGPPSICVLEDGHLLVFYGSHGRHHQIARSQEPYDVSGWTESKPMDDVPGGTYPSPVVYEGDVYVLYRAGPSWYEPDYPSARYGTIVRSTDGGRSFEDLGPVIDATGHPDELDIAYVKDMTAADGRLYFSWFICHDPAIPTTAQGQHRSGIYHAAYDLDDGAIYGMDGTRFEAPLTWEEMDGTVIEAFGGQDVNHPKHVFTEDGPMILYNHYNPAAVNFDDGTSRIEWYVTSWRDGRWETERIVDPREPTHTSTFATHLFDGGYPRLNEDGQFEAHIITGGDDPDLVDGKRGGNFEVFTKTDDGWAVRTVATAADEGTPLSRVTTVENGRDEFASLFQPASDDATAFDIPLYACGTAWDDGK